MIIKRSKSVPDSRQGVEDRQKCSTCSTEYQFKGTQCACTPLPFATTGVIDIHSPAVNPSESPKDGNVVACSGPKYYHEEKLPRLPKARRSKSLSTDTWEGVDTVTREELLCCASSLQCKRPPSSDATVLTEDTSLCIGLNGKSAHSQGTVAFESDKVEDTVNGDVSNEELPKPETPISLIEAAGSSGAPPVSLSAGSAVQSETSGNQPVFSDLTPDPSEGIQVTLKMPQECLDVSANKEHCDEHPPVDTTAAPSSMDNDSLDAEWPPDDDSNPITICGICYDYTGTRGVERNRLPNTESTETWECNVCSNSFCKNCKQSYYESRIFDGFTNINCPGDQCTRIVRDEEIERYVSENSFRVYQKNRVELENDPLRKTCPGCSKIYTFIENNVPDQVVCSVCSLRWCVPCYAPWHSNLTCQEFQKDINVKGGRKALKSWAKSKGKVAANAKKCPKCKFYIERISGCDHMTCTRCSTDFCYRCGKRHKSLRLLGNHYSTYSFLGCKYNLFPNKPAARIFVRSSVLVSLACLGVVAIGVVIAAGSVLVAASPIIGTAVAIKKCKNK